MVLPTEVMTPERLALVVTLPAVSEAAVPVRLVPAPLKPVAVSRPVEGLKVSFDDEVFCAWLPEVVVTQVGYMVALVAVSSVIAVSVALPALPVAEPALPVMLAFIEVVEMAENTPLLIAARPLEEEKF